MFSRHLSQIVLFEKSGPDAKIRLAGTAMCNWFERELKGCEFGSLWTRGARISIQAALARTMTLVQPMVIESLAETEEGQHIGVEILLLPLLDARGQATMVLGYFQPLDPIARLWGKPVQALRFLGMSEAGLDTAGAPATQTPARGKAVSEVPARPNLRLVVSNPLPAAAAPKDLFPVRPRAALDLVD
ncbi:MAG TPA: hypothetical protein DCL54_14720 [Alphaproteobacteria bacterium]|nr:hypothetical protein [Alphaproteobacteria bacterium]